MGEYLLLHPAKVNRSLLSAPRYMTFLCAVGVCSNRVYVSTTQAHPLWQARMHFTNINFDAGILLQHPIKMCEYWAIMTVLHFCIFKDLYSFCLGFTTNQ